MKSVRWLVITQTALLITLLFTSWLIGGMTGYTTIAMVITLLGFILWHARQFFLLYRWLLKGRKSAVPECDGPWYKVSDALHRWRQSSRKDRKNLLSVINEFRTSTEALQDAVVILDSRGSIIWCNKASKKLLGLHRKRDIANRITHLIRTPKFIKYLEKEKFKQPLTIASPVSSEIMLDIQITPYLKGQKLMVCRDVSLLHRLEQVRQDFVANVSHELRTPLTVVHGYLEIMDSMQTLDKEQFKKMVDEMSSQTRRMKNIVDELLYLARMEQGLKIKTETAIDMPVLLGQIKQEAIALSGDSKHNIELQIDCEKGLLALSEDIHKVFSNLVFNAVRYTAKAGEILVRWNCDENGATFSVTDNGVGIAAEDIPRLTERFYRVDRGRAREEGGSGLGLAIVKHTLERYQAKLIIDSELEKGSTFTCQFGSDWLK